MHETEKAASLEELGARLRELSLEKAPYVDGTTKLPAKEYFFAQAPIILRELYQYGGRADIVYINVGNMKAFNARCGFAAGDALLRHVAQVIQEEFPEHLVAYFGDDRFVLLADDREVEPGIARLSAKVRSYSEERLTTIRAGIARYWQTPDLDVRLACDAAKVACDDIRGRYNKVHNYYDEEIGAFNEKRQRVLDRFGKALEEGHFKVFYQPIVSTLSNGLCEAEALVRWIEPDGSVVSPADFIPALEDARLVHRLDLRMLQLICDDLKELERRGVPPFPVTLNLSRHDFEVCDIVQLVGETIERNGVSGDLIRIEVTENAFMDNPELIKEAIERFHTMGLQVWMDDFGSGYSSLNAMREYDFDVIKIDMGFLRRLNSDEMKRRTRVMLEHVVDMAKQLGLHTLTEGAEDADQIEFLRRIGCEKIQGYAIAKPMPFDDLVGKIDAGDLTVQPLAYRAFIDEVGLMNLAHPVDAASDDPTGVATGLPVAVFEYRPGHVRYFMANSAYLRALRELGFDNLDISEKTLATQLGKVSEYGISPVLPKVVETDEWVPVRYHAGQMAAAGYLRRMAQDEETGTWAVLFFALGRPRFPD